MNTFFGIETEVEHRRHAYEREQAAEGRAALARSHGGWTRSSRLRRTARAVLRVLSAMSPAHREKTHSAESEENPWTRVPLMP
jgi:hypothetical protein